MPGVLHSRARGEHATDDPAWPRRTQPQHPAFAVVEVVAERRAHRLRHAAPDARFASERDLGEEGMMDVAAEQADRGWRVAAPSRGDVLEQPGHAMEGVLERRPVLEVEVAPHAFGPARGQPAPGPVADRLVPRLEVVQAGHHEDRQRRADQ
jgi:hypothetical protein